MMYVWSDLYALLHELAIYIVDGKKTEFIEADIWKDDLNLERDLSLSGQKRELFFQLLNKSYEMQPKEKDKEKIVTLGDVKDLLKKYSDIAD